MTIQKIINTAFCFSFFIFILIPTVRAGDDLPPAEEVYNKALSNFKAHHWDAAKEYFHEYLAEYSDTPLYVTCLYNLAYSYQQLGNTEQAMVLYHRVLDQAHGDDLFWAQMAEKRIQDLASINP